MTECPLTFCGLEILELLNLAEVAGRGQSLLGRGWLDQPARLNEAVLAVWHEQQLQRAEVMEAVSKRAMRRA